MTETLVAFGIGFIRVIAYVSIAQVHIDLSRVRKPRRSCDKRA